MDYRLERDQYARIYGCTPRSIGNYQEHDAPLDEPERMYHWLWKRRTQPSGFTGKTVEELQTAYATACARGAELDSFLRQEIRELMHDIDIDQLRVRCKLMAAEQKGYTPEYAAAVRGAMNKIVTGVREVFRAFGLKDDDTHTWRNEDDEDDEDDEFGEEADEEEAEEPADNIVTLPTQTPQRRAPVITSAYHG